MIHEYLNPQKQACGFKTLLNLNYSLFNAENIILWLEFEFSLHLILTHSYHSRVKINSEADPAPRLTLTVIAGDYNRRRAGPDAYYHVGFVRDIVCPADSDNFLQCVVDGSSRPFVLLCLWCEQPAGWINY